MTSSALTEIPLEALYSSKHSLIIHNLLFCSVFMLNVYCQRISVLPCVCVCVSLQLFGGYAPTIYILLYTKGYNNVSVLMTLPSYIQYVRAQMPNFSIAYEWRQLFTGQKEHTKTCLSRQKGENCTTVT